MKHRVVMAGVLLVASILAGCATVPGASGMGASPTSRPMSDVTPATPAETRARVHVDLGMAYFEIGRYDVALDEARIALNDVPTYAPAYHLLGLAYMLIEEFGPARENFELALRHAPGDPEFNNSYGWFLYPGRGAARARASRPFSAQSLLPACDAALYQCRLVPLAPQG